MMPTSFPVVAFKTCALFRNAPCGSFTLIVLVYVGILGFQDDAASDVLTIVFNYDRTADQRNIVQSLK